MIETANKVRFNPLETLDQDLIAKIQGIELKAKHLVTDVFAGDYRSVFKGRGMEFEEVREYVPGDDIRNIDWNVTARTGKTFIKTYRDEREQTIIFMVDVSASSRFGSHTKLKNELASEVTALLSYAALKNNDKIGLIIFSDHIEHYVPPRKGKGHIWRIIRDILTYESRSKNTNINVPLSFLLRVLKRRATVFVISDFLGSDFEKSMLAASMRHDLIAIHIQDQLEKTFPDFGLGFMELEDAESGEQLLVKLGDKRFVDNYKKYNEVRLEQQRHFFGDLGVDLIEIETNISYMDSIVKFFKTREKRSR